MESPPWTWNMSSYKYACPYCGQHVEYTDEYAGQQTPCPTCRQSIMFPALPGGLRKTSLRLVRDIPKPVRKFEFSFGGLIIYLREFQHWKVVGICVLPFAILAGALCSAAWFRQHEPPPDALPPAAITNAESPVAPETAPLPADLDQATLQVRARVSDVKKAAASLQAAQRHQAAVLNQYKNSPAGQPDEQAADAAIKDAQKSLAAARDAFTTSFTNYQALGGPIDYRRQLP